MPETTDRHLNESCHLRANAWSTVGAVEPDAYVVKNGRAGRDKLADLLQKRANLTYSDLARKSVV
ncbi:MAG TPA: hypothetical protein V6C72_12030 [Chroococcales cyanobacterium]